MNPFDQLYEVPDVDEPLEPCFDIDPMIWWELDLEYMQGEM